MDGLTDKILRANASGQIVEYHQFIQKRTANHIDNPVTSQMLVSKMNQELANSNVDGWCDEVVIIQHTLTDDVHFYGYAAATESASPALVIPLWVVLAIIAAAATVLIVYGWFIYDFFSAVLEKAIPTNYYTTQQGERTSSYTEYVTLQRQYYWLVCPKCGMGFADKNDHPTWELIPQEIHDAYEEHVANCTGIPTAEAFPWLVVAAIGGVVAVVIGIVWVGSQVLKKEAPPIIITR